MRSASNDVGNLRTPLQVPKETHGRPRHNVVRIKLMRQLCQSPAALALPKPQPFIRLVIGLHAYLLAVTVALTPWEHLEACGQGRVSSGRRRR